MDNVRLQISIPGWSLQKLEDESVDLPLMLKVAGIPSFEIAEVRSKTAPISRHDGDVVVGEETFALNTEELENKRPFCSTPRTSLLTPVPFPPVEASRISANPAKIVEWISRRGNTRETLTGMIKTETSMPADSEKSREQTIEDTASFVQFNDDLDDVILEDNNEHNVSFHSVSSSIPDESEEIQNLQRTAELVEKSASSTTGAEEISRKFDATIQFEDLRTYPSFAFSREMRSEISKSVYELLTPMKVHSSYKDLFKSIPESSTLDSPSRQKSLVHNDHEDIVMETEENGDSGDEEQNGGPVTDVEVDRESISENRDVHPVERMPNTECLSEIRCQFPGCKTTMNWRPKFGKARLLNHAFRHAAEGIVKCRTCNQPFNNTRTLRRHLKKAHSTEPIPSGMKCIEIPDDVLSDLWRKCYSASLPIIGIPVTQSKQKRLKRRTLEEMLL